MSGGSCPDEAIASQLEQRLGDQMVPHARAAAAVARARATRALAEARQLYTQTNFAGCVSLLSISELELGRWLADPNPSLQHRSHRLLAQVMLWLGICQWAGGEPQTAGASFLRSAQLPSAPTPDPTLLPPELVQAYREAVAAPRQQVSCQLDAPLTADQLQVDGKGPTVSDGNVIVPAGSHYVVIKVACPEPGDSCQAVQREVGPGGMRSLRLEAQADRCRIRLPAVRVPSRIACISASEAAAPAFVAKLTAEGKTDGTLVVDVSRRKVTMRLHRAGATSFHHQLVSNLRGAETPAEVVARSAPLLLGGQAPVEPPPPPPPGSPWYKKWWVWAIAGTVIAGVTATAVLATSSDRVKVVFGP